MGTGIVSFAYGFFDHQLIVGTGPRMGVMNLGDIFGNQLSSRHKGLRKRRHVVEIKCLDLFKAMILD